MKKIWAAVILLAIGAVLFFAWKRNPALPEKTIGAGGQTAETGASPQATSNKTSLENARPVPKVGTGENPATSLTAQAASPGSALPAPGADQNLPPATVLENVSRSIHQYGERFGGNPVGTNPEITAALNGGNPKQVNFISPAAGMKINGRGELVDAWGTPYFFHQISGSEMEIHSAGPDKIMWTADDLVTK